MDLYGGKDKLYGGKDYYSYHLEYEEIDVEVVDFSMELERLNINRLDLLKLDIQGSEYEVLSSLLTTSIRPLVIHCEVLQVPIYFDTCYGCEIDALLLSAHYICIRRWNEHFRGGCLLSATNYMFPIHYKKKDTKSLKVE